MKLQQFLIVIFCVIVLINDVSGAPKKKKKSKRMRDPAAENFFSGVTPAGNTKWEQESKRTIIAHVDTSHLKFDRLPHYFCTVSVDSRKVFFPDGSNYTLGDSPAARALANVTGMYTPVRASSNGFSVRLRYNSESAKNITVSDATREGWRIRWVALTEGHPMFEDARAEIINPRYDESVEVKPVSPSLAYIKSLEMLVNEDSSVIEAMLGSDYEITKSRRLQRRAAAKKAKEEAEAAKKAEEAAKAAKEAKKAAKKESAKSEDSTDAKEEATDDAENSSTE